MKKKRKVIPELTCFRMRTSRTLWLWWNRGRRLVQLKLHKIHHTSGVLCRQRYCLRQKIPSPSFVGTLTKVRSIWLYNIHFFFILHSQLTCNVKLICMCMWRWADTLGFKVLHYRLRCGYRFQENRYMYPLALITSA